MNSDLIYLDHAATTPLAPAVRQAMEPYWSCGNPASAHRAGRRARQALEDAREEIARLLGAAASEVVFTSGATEANNLALFGLAGAPPGHVLTSQAEHPSVVESVRQLVRQGHAVEFLPVNRQGVNPASALAERLRPDTRLVSIQLVNHETGVVQPIAELARAVPPGCQFHCDAAQAAGKLPIRFHDLGVTALTISGHKLHGPVGIGALLLRQGTALEPRQHGGHQQHGRRPGTEPVALAVGLAAALRLACQEMDERRRKVEALRARFLNDIRRQVSTVAVNPPEGNPLPYLLNLSFPGCAADVLLMKLDLAGVACSTGSACSSGSLLPSPVLEAMGTPPELLCSAMRFSFSPLLTEAEVEEAARRVGRVVSSIVEPAGDLNDACG